MAASSNFCDLIYILKSHVVRPHLLAEASARRWGRGRLKFFRPCLRSLGTTRRAADGAASSARVRGGASEEPCGGEAAEQRFLGLAGLVAAMCPAWLAWG